MNSLHCRVEIISCNGLPTPRRSILPSQQHQSAASLSYPPLGYPKPGFQILPLLLGIREISKRVSEQTCGPMTLFLQPVGVGHYCCNQCLPVLSTVSSLFLHPVGIGHFFCSRCLLFLDASFNHV